jgi:AcrR family transcriptional regulator
MPARPGVSYYLMIVTTPNRSATPTLRERKRLRAMKRVQREAVARFTERGFDAVTVEEIAEAADVSPMSVYRWFGTKEALVVWDEFDPPILAAVADRLPDKGPLDAVHDAVVDLLGDIYDRERGISLQRAQLIYREPALMAAADRNGRMLRSALAELFVDRTGTARHHARVAAAVAGTLLEVAIDAWQRDAGRRPLADLLTETFAAHRELGR